VQRQEKELKEKDSEIARLNDLLSHPKEEGDH